MRVVRKVGLLILLIEAGTMWIADRHRPPVPEPPRENLPHLGGSVGTFTYSPSTLTFTSSDPDVVATSPLATIFVNMTGPIGGKPWNLKVQASSSTLGNCASVPTSAISAVCGSFAPGGNGNNPTGACAGSFPLSTSLQTVASGVQGDGGSDTFTITMTYRFTDAWKYPGATSPACSLSLSYQFNWDI